MDVRPVGQVINGSVIEFDIPGTSNSYVDLKNSKLCVRLKFLTEDNSAVSPANKTALANNAANSIFSQCEISLQQKNTTSGIATNYPYKALLDILTDPETKSRRECLERQLFYKDNGGAMDDADPAAGANLGLFYRHQYTRNGDVVDLETPVYSDICQQNRLIINGVPISFKF